MSNNNVLLWKPRAYYNTDRDHILRWEFLLYINIMREL